MQAVIRAKSLSAYFYSQKFPKESSHRLFHQTSFNYSTNSFSEALQKKSADSHGVESKVAIASSIKLLLTTQPIHSLKHSRKIRADREIRLASLNQL
ncbi:MAG: hypothetical protein F6K22_03245 [Okeania sp. SIO2F4]|uniref:hypothetical protein n=1 Tax=Okeania sp. SIO2F4 TaxID=2607790 RepID=UPI00142B5488|nr:hypothetical protein [Okeania sp. SIO2F4]NES01929.1 hypothetical protein [Okeania sp. SIO2F4]